MTSILEKVKSCRILGHGALSTVYAIPNCDEKVIKIGHSPSKDGWLPYMNWAIERGFTGGLSPKIYSFICVSHYMSLAIVERLEPLDNYEKAENLVVSLQEGRGMACIPEKPMYCPYEFTRFCYEWNRAFPTNDGFDCYGTNIMQRRSNGSIVINDPLGYVNSRTEPAMSCLCDKFFSTRHMIEELL